MLVNNTRRGRMIGAGGAVLPTIVVVISSTTRLRASLTPFAVGTGGSRSPTQRISMRSAASPSATKSIAHGLGASLRELDVVSRIDGLDIHFIHVRSKDENALPVIATHGWPGSIIEQLKIIDPLTNSHGPWRERIGCVRNRDSVAAGLWILGKPTATARHSHEHAWHCSSRHF